MRIGCSLGNLSVLVREFGSAVFGGRMEDAALSETSQDFDVYNAMDWKDGIGTLPGSELKFKVNEFGVLEVITDDAEVENVKKAHATTTWSVPTAQEVFSDTWPTVINQDRATADSLCCERCKGSGPLQEFSGNGRFCSEKCFHETLKVNRTTRNENIKSDCEELSRSIRKRKLKLPVIIQGHHKENGQELKEEKDDPLDKKIQKGTQRIRRRRRNDASLLKHTVPYGGKRKSWCWASYLEQEKAIAVPSKLFKEHQTFPQSKNSFKVGMKLEGVDPEHPSKYCVLTVAEVCGYRMRLHFDQYSECYDFWVNANSSDIHPVGWCEKTGHKLNPPKGEREGEFNWQSYLKLWKAQPAPKSLFENQNTTITPSGFRVGMKLEAVDRKNPALVCVATVSDMVDNRFLVHFDSWDESYDYWCDATSPYIHPVGWCEEHGKILTTPPGYHNITQFTWERYLDETSSLPAPARAFKVKPAHGFQNNMKLELVDKRNPVLIRVATIVETDDHRLKIHLDGWGDEYDFWVDADSPDIHPAGWCAKTGHPLQPPTNPNDVIESSEDRGCPTPGCNGIGHIKGARYSGHHSSVGCPYSDINLNKESVLSDRLSGEILTNPAATKNKRAEMNGVATHSLLEKNVTFLQNNHNNILMEIEARETDAGHQKKTALCENNGKKAARVGRPCKKQKVHGAVDEEETVESEVSSVNETKETEELTLQQALHQSVFMPSTSPLPSSPLCWEQHSKLLPSVAGITASKVAQWTVEEVTEFIQHLPGCREQVKTFREEQIDGEAFLLLTQVDLVKIMNIKLGPALKIYNSILMFKTAENSFNEL
ncbi:lethal(3)malignant brain tumor-like protein 3 [Erpetoichthys calabaricus]|uniref:lethal(3)malignant brain tumor-like protein 3 n=1 Tax=Erpetoichthys calabaricus TaxID=27687 RepID=UPI0022345A7F|nr:lethal(3)malignant brain tumor-like protein 3 [Erpetoichthys calabaricus]